MHLLFFLVTWTVSTNHCPAMSHLRHGGHTKEHAAQAGADHSATPGHNPSGSGGSTFEIFDLFEDYENDTTYLNGGGAHHMSKQDLQYRDCWAFNAMRWGHLLTFTLQILGFILKYKEYYNTS